jgi:microcompartment protein CcmL/EutN
LANNSLGLIELSSIAAGFAVTDAMLKAADVELVLARTICSGKYMVLVRGNVGDVEAAVRAGQTTGDFSLVDTFIIPNVHESLFPALAGISHAEALEGADAMAKAANVHLVEVRLAMALGGKAFATITGSVSAVRSALEAGAQSVSRKGLLVNKVLIPNPRPELLHEMI